MTTMTHSPGRAARVFGGVDAHKDVHVAAALDELGRLLGTGSFPTTTAGYQQLWRWLRSWARSSRSVSMGAGRGVRAGPSSHRRGCRRA
jgi:hypothetical protein